MSDSTVYHSLGLALAARRKSVRVTQSELAARIGMTRASLANIEAGRQTVALHQLYALVEALALESILDLVPAAAPSRAPRPRIDGAGVTDADRAQAERLFGVRVDADQPLAAAAG